jgi:hypothetical protein
VFPFQNRTELNLISCVAPVAVKTKFPEDIFQCVLCDPRVAALIARLSSFMMANGTGVDTPPFFSRISCLKLLALSIASSGLFTKFDSFNFLHDS